MGRIAVFLCLFSALGASAGEIWRGGHLKARLEAAGLPDDSLRAVHVDDPALDQAAAGRLKFAAGGGAWAFATDYQLSAQFGDSLALDAGLSGALPRPRRGEHDRRRLLDLSHSFSDDGDSLVQHRLDRLHLNYRREKWVLRVGRQAISWGNGLAYNPMDFFNPFSPVAVDTEYKTGDDMAYGQYLRDNGDDWQWVWVVRRDSNANLDADVNSLAVKYHGFAATVEYDLLLAQHYGDSIWGLGGSVPFGGAVVRGDITLTDTDEDIILNAVASWSYSRVTAGYNMSAALEYFHSGFGQNKKDYSPAALRDNEALLERILRGELFSLGKHYLTASVLVEITPLLQLTPRLFLNLEDDSFVAQLAANYSVARDWELIGSVNLPVGSSGTEYGGFESGVDGLKIADGPSVFAQLAWYF